MVMKYIFITLLSILVCFLTCYSSLHSLSVNDEKSDNSFSRFMRLSSYLDEKIHRHRKKSKQPDLNVDDLGAVLNVDDFGATGNGTDDSKAFSEAWIKACSSKDSVLLVPFNRTYYLKPVKFCGPCQPNFTINIQGTIKASTNISDYEGDRRLWINFVNLRDFKVEGGGTINGNGDVWWQNSCKINKTLPCIEAPTAVTFENCTNLNVSNIRIKNAQQMHLTFLSCVDVDASDIIITSPEKSPNTDGIHVTATQNIHINNSIIATGDDCISIVSGSKFVQATNILCGPGHGISIGSLGYNHSEDQVSDVLIDGATLTGTTNGARIKTWQGGRGYAKNIVFQNILMRNVSNPIIIDQYYCDEIEKPCPEQNEAVEVTNIVYKNIRGTSASNVAMNFDCSKSIPCANIVIEDVYFFREEDGFAEANCANVILETVGNVFPKCDQMPP